MVIKASSRKEVDALLADLASDRPITRDGAVARLTVLGERVVPRLIALATNPTAAPTTRAAAFLALDGIADPRSLQAALGGLADQEATVAATAAGLVGALLPVDGGVRALDRLTAASLDTTRSTEVRLAALRALGRVDAATVGPVFAALRGDTNAAIAGAASAYGPEQATPTALACVNEAAAGRLPDDPSALKQALSSALTSVPLQALAKIVDQVRVREGAEQPPRRDEWARVRAAAHAALAARGSRLALYDLRETVAAAREPLAVEFLAALGAIGDSSCLEPIAGAYETARIGGRPPDDWWRRSLSDAFRRIALREGITRRHAVARRIEKRWPLVIEPLFQCPPASARRAGSDSTSQR